MPIIYDSYLCHHGVKGMKWGHRKQRPVSDLRRRYDEARVAKKQANKQYSKSYDKAYGYSYFHPVSQWVKKSKAYGESRKRWTKALEDAGSLNARRKEFKTVRKERNTALRSTYKKIKRSASLFEKGMYNSATRRKAAKYVVDNDMTVKEATRKAHGDAWKNAAAYIAICGAVKIAPYVAREYKNYKSRPNYLRFPKDRTINVSDFTVS